MILIITLYNVIKSRLNFRYKFRIHNIPFLTNDVSNRLHCFFNRQMVKVQELHALGHGEERLTILAKTFSMPPL